MLTTFGNTESMCTAQGGMIAALAPSASPKTFFQAGYATCTTASLGTCAGYATLVGLPTALPACAPAYGPTFAAIASAWAAGDYRHHLCL